MTEPASADWLVHDELAPATVGILAPLYSAAAEGSLAMPFCPGCDRPLELEQVVCADCGGQGPRWRDVERHGIVHAVTVVHRRERSLIRAQHPYPVIDVELSSGHRIVMTTTEATERPPAIGEGVGIGFRTVGGVALPAANIGNPDTEVSP